MPTSEIQYAHANISHVNQSSSQQNTSSMGSLPFDPALLYAKLEVAKLEQDAVRRALRERQSRTKKEQQYGVEPKLSTREQRSIQRDLLRRSLPLEAEWTADGKPCLNTAQILAALETTPLTHGSVLKKDQSSGLLRGRDTSSGMSSDNDVVPGLDIHRRARRHFKSEDTATKLVAIKHGSQTTYERVDLPGGKRTEDSELLEHQDDELSARPKLSKYDRPHWAQQSQNASDMRRLKNAISAGLQRKARPKSEVPATTRNDITVAQRPPLGQRQSSNTLVSDAVKEIKKEQRLKKLQSVSTLFRHS